MPRLVVVGAGVAGLAAAGRLAQGRPDAEVLVLESADRIGGKLHRVEVGGSWIDVGAESMLARRPEGLAAAHAAGLTEQIIHPLTTSALLRTRGSNRPLPARTLMGMPTDLDATRASGVLSEADLNRIAAEPDQDPLPPMSADVSVGDLVAERFGPAVVARLVDPLLGGVYAGQADAISLRAAIPALAQRLAERGGSLLEAARTIVAQGAREDNPAPVFASIRGGLALLTQAMATIGTFEVRTSSTVRAIRRDPTGFTLSTGAVGRGQELHADGVVLATPAGKTATLLADTVPSAATELRQIETASMVIVTLAFAGAIALPEASGMLVPQTEGLDVKAMTFSSQKWPGVGGGVSSGGVTLLRASLGRAGDERTVQRADSELIETVRRELATMTGVGAVPIDIHVQRWGGALPQYAVGHLDRVSRIRSAVAGVAGLGVCGASYDGVGIPACISSAHRAADQVLAGLVATSPAPATFLDTARTDVSQRAEDNGRHG
ncbi:MAG TPA: protoporphyrinogen oxidase [Jatrophihabitans sp.]|jgi:oxygen-dependent protoporphyrinogen oxidase